MRPATAHVRRLSQLAVKPRRVEIEWIDSAQKDGWNDATDVLDDVDHPDYMTCHTTGYLINETDLAVTVALSYTVSPKTGLHEEYGNPLTIPRIAIRDIHDLRR